MANTFKVKTVQNVPNTSAFVYRCPDDTTAVVLGMLVSNTNATADLTCTANMITNSAETKDVRGGAVTETNYDTCLLPAVPIPRATSLELFSGQKIVLQATDGIKIKSSITGLSMDVTLTLMEMT